MYTKIPLSPFKVKKEVEERGKVVVYTKHSVALLVHKSNAIIKNSK